MQGTIRLVPTGNLGNQMLQVLLLDGLRRRHPGLRVGGIDLPMWGLSREPGLTLAAPSLRVGGQFVDTDWLCLLFRWRVLRELDFGALGFDIERYPDPDECRQLFSRREAPPFVGRDHELVINVRGAETLDAVHPDYAPLPLAYYRYLVACTGLAPVFMGQLGDDPYSTALRGAFPEARFLPSFGAMADFEVLRSSRHVAASVSTFSWLACWMSDAQSVHLPVSGILDPLQRPDIALLPLHDPRYRFYEAPTFRNLGPGDWQRHVASDGPFGTYAPDVLASRVRAARAAVEPLRRRFRARVLVHALAQRALRRASEVVSPPLRPSSGPSPIGQPHLPAPARAGAPSSTPRA